jgi:hypothetical protein
MGGRTPTKPRSLKREQQQLAAQLRDEDMTWPEIATVFGRRYRVNARVALRLVHGWSQQEAADRWNHLWPDDPKTFKNFSYWERWPSPTGYEPSLGVLSRLAELYHCHIADLLTDSKDFRAQDAVHRARETLGALQKSVANNGTSGAIYETMADEEDDPAQISIDFVNRIQETDVRDLAMMASIWVKRLDSSANHNALLFKLSFALTLAAANPLGRPGDSEMPPPASNGILELGGIWRSRYSYFSSGRGQEFDSTHYVMFRQNGQQVTAESLPHHTGSKFSLSLTLDGFILTGTWVEHTSPTGYYKGAIYRGAIQLLASPSGGQLIGKWIGFGKNFNINTGDWEFVLETRSASDDDIARYSMRDDD